jgi:hypothetical protein
VWDGGGVVHLWDGSGRQAAPGSAAPESGDRRAGVLRRRECCCRDAHGDFQARDTAVVDCGGDATTRRGEFVGKRSSRTLQGRRHGEFVGERFSPNYWPLALSANHTSSS